MSATLTLDHVTLAWSSLEPLERALVEVGLRADYGGPHGNRATHMDVLGFDDGSYVELIAPFEPGAPMAWEVHLRGDAGPSAWAVTLSGTPELAAEAERMRARGVTVRGPMPSSRMRPDGQHA
ncbi:MAG TPA: VOC family protein, partial [Ktedonobacterales bacterium]|nr:VOC family protein [Ktedonobacterales bacterium]